MYDWCWLLATNQVYRSLRESWAKEDYNLQTLCKMKI